MHRGKYLSAPLILTMALWCQPATSADIYRWIDEEGVVRWSEVCYCETPLLHERKTVYDQHFTEIETEEVECYVKIEGRPFMEYLRGEANA